MMNLQRIERFQLDGREFPDIASAREYVESEIGKVIDSTPIRLHPKQALDVYNAIVKNKERLRALLSVMVERDNAEDVNILDEAKRD
jgi:hypothetical protein